MRTIDKIITKVNSKYGAPMGRANVGERPKEILPDMSDLDTKDTLLNNFLWISRKKALNKKLPKVFDTAVPMSGAYDKGGAYWGIGKQLRVSYTKDLSFINFYRID
jgi:hypothetical protein